MTWTPLPNDEYEFVNDVVAVLRERGSTALPERCTDVGLEATAMRDILVSWVSLWTRTARTAGYPDDWLPSRPDVSKSALFERIRSGKAPLMEPPPVGLACPWYALIEEPDAQFVSPPWFDPSDADKVVVLQNPYAIVARQGDEDMTLRDLRHATSYRFRLWFDRDANRDAPARSMLQRGGWYIRNAALEPRDAVKA